MIALYPYQPRSFLTLLGSLAAVRRLKTKGFPDNLRNWRFVTLTVDRSEYPDPAEAYDIGTRHMREFVYQLRQNYDIKRWCWKLEFHSPDDRTGEIYPHWHLLFDYKRPIPAEEISALWGKGRTEIRGVRDSGFNYLFKYLGKGASSLPDWILSRFRIRLFQTSRGFFPELPVGCTARDIEKPSPRLAPDPSESDTQNDRFGCQAESIGERLKRWARSVVSRSDDERGVRYRLHIGMTETWGDLLVRAAKAQFAQRLSEQQISITTNRIHASCHQSLPRSLLLYQQAFS